MTVWFDVEDLVHYFHNGNKRISGIQRLSFEIFRGVKALEGPGVRVGFVRHGARPPALLSVDWSELVAEFGAEQERARPQRAGRAGPAGPAVQGAEAEQERRSWPRRLARRAAGRLPPELRRPLVLASVMQIQVLAALDAFSGNAATWPVRRAYASLRQLGTELAWRARRPARRPAAPQPLEELARPGDALLVLGAPWNRERYSDIARWVRDERRMRFGVLVHDLVPIRHPEWCHRGVPRSFREWYTDVLPFCDVVLANSRHTALDVEAYARESGLVLNARVQALPVGTGFGAQAVGPGPAAAEGLPEPGSYVLFVSTLEARKNHALAVRVWSLLLDEVAAGKRPADSVPDLVFAGGIGWLVADLLGQLDHTQWLGGRVRLVQDPTDAELRALYAGSLFTLFPSLHEGWGLPVTESLALGKPCLCSDAASLPEAGGALCRYFDPQSLGSAYRAVVSVLDDRPGLARWEAQVRREFRPVPWTETARALLDAVAGLEGRGGQRAPLLAEVRG